MASIRIPRPWLGRARRLTAGVLFAAYLVTSLGIPIPEVVAKEAHQVPSPAPRSCCGTGKCCCSDEAPKSCCSPARQETSEDDQSWHLRFSAPRCGCLTKLWVSTTNVLPTLPVPAWSPALIPLDRVPDYEPAILVRSSIPPDPPPRQQS
jgi:hypothetical protein